MAWRSTRRFRTNARRKFDFHTDLHVLLGHRSVAVVRRKPVWKSNFNGAFVLNRRVDLHAIDATPARWRGDAGSSPLDGASTATSSPSAPDTLVDFHTATDPRARK